MIKLFDVYFPIRVLLRVFCEVSIVWASFLIATEYCMGPDTSLSLVYEGGLLKIAVVSLITLLLSYYFDLYEPQRVGGNWEIYFRLLLVVGVLSFVIAGMLYVAPQMDIGPNVFLAGLAVLASALLSWRYVYEWVAGLPAFRERVYILGNGPRARSILDTLRGRHEIGMDATNQESLLDPTSEQFRDRMAELRADIVRGRTIDRIVVAMEDRRGKLPLRELLELRLNGVIVEDANSLMERLCGILPIEGLQPSSLIFTDGFRVRALRQVTRRVMSIFISFTGLVLCLPIIPVIMLAVRLSSPGAIFFKQTRVGLRGHHFSLYKFRTMKQDAEKNGAVWASQNDPRVTSVGRFLRMARLDEIPQLWNVLRGDMAFVGPRPERPEFVEWLDREVPFYELRHMILPGITGWAQVRYRYGASLDDTKRKLEYDLFYIKHQSLGLDLLIVFETLKTILLRRGAQ